MFSKKIPIYYIIFSAVLGGLISYLAIVKPGWGATRNADSSQLQATKNAPCNDGAVRLKGYHYVDQLLYEEMECESEWLGPLKQEINSYIESQKQSGLTNASVYIKVFSNDDWIAINPDEQYHPASLLKLPVLFTFARMAETNPQLLDEKVFFEKHDATLPKQIFVSKTLQPGTAYTIKELLRYLIAYSDNDALYLLYNYHSPEVYQKVFSDLKMPMPEMNRDVANTTVTQYSVFLKVLYNGSYLSPSSSEFVLSYLAESDFKQGILKGLPPSTKVAHKFGEYYKGDVFELHESAIVYSEGYNYLITIMTRGNNMNELSDVLGNISNMVYTKLGPEKVAGK